MYTRAKVAEQKRKMRRRKGRRGKGREWGKGEEGVEGVVRKGMRMEEVRPMKRRVTRSPRQEAIGGAMLSVGVRLV